MTEATASQQVTCSEGSAHSNSGRIKIVFRYDDFSSQSPTKLDVALIESLGEHHCAATFAVVPAMVEGNYRDPSPRPMIELSPEKVRLLRTAIERKVVEPALHGLNHQSHRSREAGGFSEFAGLSYAEQRAKICRGKELLEQQAGVEITTFVPPWNSYDANTLRVIQEAGFTAISAGLWGTCGESSQLTFVPSTCPLNLGALRSAVAVARAGDDPEPVIVVLFHPSDFEDTGAGGATTIPDFRAILRWTREQADVDVVTVARLSRSGENLGPTRMVRNLCRTQSYASRLLPTYAKESQVYWSVDSCRSSRWVKVAAFHATVSLGSGVFGWLMWLDATRSGSLARAAAFTAVVIVCALHVARRMGPNRLFRIALTSCCLLGVGIGSWCRIAAGQCEQNTVVAVTDPSR
jgi:peptidoglycan/xylan/chitin deacetylase (PgdA/CDA1 family)